MKPEGVSVINKPEKPASTQAQAQDRYQPGDPIPVPEVSEANTESAWALFSELAQIADDVKTVPASLMDELTPAPDPNS
jgi:hypothetical protein